MPGIFSMLFGKNDKIKMLNSDEFLTALNNDKEAVLIDVRTNEEYQSQHIPKSRLIDIYSSDFVEVVSKLNKEKNYYIYCRSGVRSMNAANKMVKLGFKNVTNLKGGIKSWNGPTE